MAFEDILWDRQRGASEIEVRLVERLAERFTPTEGSLEALTREALSLHGEMANLVRLLNRLWLAWESVEGKEDLAAEALAEAIEARRAELQRGDRGVAGSLLAEALAGRSVVLTLSRSGTVLRALGELWEMNGAADAGSPLLERVILGEGRPLREGVTAARELAAAGVATAVVTDAVLLGLPLSGPGLPEPLDLDPARAAVLLGTDALTAQGVVNKSGSLPLALAAREAGIPVLVAASEDKLLPAALTRDAAPSVGDPVDLGAPAAVGPVNRPFERLPWELVTRVLLGGESLTSEEVLERAREQPASRRLAELLEAGPAPGR